MKYIVEDYLDYLQEKFQGAGLLIFGGIMYAIYKTWRNRQEIINEYCKQYKGDSLKLDICIVESQIKKSKEIINQLQTSKHTCEKTPKPQRCYEKVNYYLDKYNSKIVQLNRKLDILQLKVSQREYKEKIKKFKEKHQQ
jgi:hypothetical protein